MRALVVIRLSRVTNATTSPERQLEACKQLCDQRGYEVVGVAEDLDVSGAVDPFNAKHRPALARWLAGENEPFDVIVAFRVDRLTRSIRHLQKLVAWAEDNGKLVVSTTEPHFDMTSPFAAVVIALMGTVAQMELEAMSERNASAARHNIRAGKYRGGVPPWGYRPSDATREWRFVPDPEQTKVIHEVVQRVLNREPLRSIAHDLTARGVLTPRDRFAQIQAREVKGYEWHSSGLKRSLTSPTLLGHAVSGGKSVRNDGSPVIRSEAILTREVFDRVGAELADRENRKEPTKRSSSLLLQVIYCGVCGKPAYRLKGGEGRKPRYRCASAQYKKTCGNKSIPMDYADDTVERIIIGMLGESERLEREWDNGSDNSAELTEINDRLTDLVSQLGLGAFRAGTPQRAALNHQIEMLAERQAVLSAQEVTPAGWTWQPTGETFGDWWSRQDTTARNIELRRMNVRLEFEPGEFRLDLGDLETMTGQMVAHGRAAEWREIFDAMQDNGIAGMEIDDNGIRFHHESGFWLGVDDGDDNPPAE